MDTRMKRLGAGALVAVGGVGLPIVAATPASASTAFSQDFSCRGSKFVFVDGFPGNINFDFSATASGYRSTTAATITSIRYAFSNAEWVGETGFPVKRLSPGSHNNVNVTYPVTRNSSDSLGGTGTINPAPFSVTKGHSMKIETFMDISGQPDPSCTATATINWK